MAKVAVILPDTEPFSPTEGGALARWVYEVYNILELDFLVLGPKTSAPYPSKKMIVLPTFRKGRLKFMGAKIAHHIKYNLYPALASITARINGADIIHILNRPSHVLVVRKLFPKAKIFLHMQNDHMSTLPDNIFHQVVKESDRIISCSSFIQKRILIRSNKSPNVKCSIIFNGANNNLFIPSFDFSIKEKNIVFAGRLVPEKGVKELILAMLPILAEKDNVRLYIVGSHSFGDLSETDYIQELKRLAKPYKEKVFFVGFLNHLELSELYKKSHLFVCPSIWEEPFGMVITEAMANGLPVVASKKGGIPEVLGNTGYLVNPENISEITESINKVLENPVLAKQLGEDGYKRFVEHFTWQKVSEKFKSIIN